MKELNNEKYFFMNMIEKIDGSKNADNTTLQSIRGHSLQRIDELNEEIAKLDAKFKAL